MAERTKLRRGRFDEIKSPSPDYQSPSNMYKKLSKAKGLVNEVRVDSIK